MRKKRELAVILSVFLAAGSLFGCGSGGENSPSDGTGQVQKSVDKPIEITWGISKPGDENAQEAYEEVVEKYNSENTGNVIVKMNYVEYTDDAQYNTWLSSQLMGGVALR